MAYLVPLPLPLYFQVVFYPNTNRVKGRILIKSCRYADSATALPSQLKLVGYNYSGLAVKQICDLKNSNTYRQFLHQICMVILCLYLSLFCFESIFYFKTTQLMSDQSSNDLKLLLTTYQLNYGRKFGMKLSNYKPLSGKV